MRRTRPRTMSRTSAEAQAERLAFLVDGKVPSGKLVGVFAKATALREEGKVVTVQPLKKNAKYQVETLEKNGYTTIRKIYADTEL